MLRLAFDHGLFYEFVPLEELDSARPSRHWLGTVEPGVNYAIVVSTCAGMWAHLIGDTVRFESLDPPLFTFTGRTRYSLSAFGEHLINEEVEGAIAFSLAETGSAVRDWHMGPVFSSARSGITCSWSNSSRGRAISLDFATLFDQRALPNTTPITGLIEPGRGFACPAVIVAEPGSFEAWMRARGKLGGQHKVPRMDSSGSITGELVGFLRHDDRVRVELPSGNGSSAGAIVARRAARPSSADLLTRPLACSPPGRRSGRSSRGVRRRPRRPRL